MDTINGVFELLGSLFILMSIIKMHKDKKVRGVSWAHVLFFLTWGYWNCVYYPSIGQWASFFGGLGIVVTNTVWFVQLVYYTIKEKRNGT